MQPTTSSSSSFYSSNLARPFLSRFATSRADLFAPSLGKPSVSQRMRPSSTSYPATRRHPAADTFCSFSKILPTPRQRSRTILCSRRSLPRLLMIQHWKKKKRRSPRPSSSVHLRLFEIPWATFRNTPKRFPALPVFATPFSRSPTPLQSSTPFWSYAWISKTLRTLTDAEKISF